MAADQIGDAGTGALVGNVHEVVEAGELLEQLAGEVAHGAGSGGAVGELAGIGLGVGDELLAAFFAGTDACTTIEVVETARMAIGTKSLAASYGTFGMVIGLSTIVLVLPSRMV